MKSKQGVTDGWTLVTEGMPEIPEGKNFLPVLVSIIDIEGQPISTIMISNGEIFLSLFPPLGHVDEEVIAWQYYPKPYVGDDGKRSD